MRSLCFLSRHLPQSFSPAASRDLPTQTHSTSVVCHKRTAVVMTAKRKASTTAPSSEPSPPTARPRLGPPTEGSPVPAPPPGVLKIMSYNVCSLRSILKTGSLRTIVDVYRPDVFMLQETKMTDEAVAKLQSDGSDVKDDKEEIPGLPYDVHWAHSTTAKGQHGVATLILRGSGLKVSALGVPDDDIVQGEGRVVALNLSSEKYGSLAVVNAYVPNSGAKLARLAYRCDVFEEVMRSYLKNLREEHGDVVYSGDLNCAHEEIDIYDSKRNSKNAGHTPEERRAFSELLGSGMVDAFRAKYADLEGAYTFWSRRSKTTRLENKGWRLDYFLVNEEMVPRIADVAHLRHFDASDHCPIMILLSPAS